MAAEPDRLITYKTIGDVELKLHVFEPQRDGDTPVPAIVFFFGGGWVGGTPTQFYPHSEYLASRGMFACAAEYRVKSSHETTPFECVADGKSAVRYLRAHAAEVGIDPDRIAAGGGSAGGHVAACTGTIEGFDEPDEDTSVASTPQALVLFNPVIDTSDKGFGHDRLGDRWEEISPNHHVSARTPPAIVFHGTGDTTVPFENVERFAAAMHDAGNACTLVPFEGRPHGFFNKVKGETDYATCVIAADRFLVEHGFLEGEPTMAAAESANK